MPPKKIIYPVFLPHAGCPFQCVYCNQQVVASHDHREFHILDVVESHLRTYCAEVLRSGRPGEIAFFGGTFSALPQALMESILAAASIHVKQGIFTGIRFSTRPDCLGDEVVSVLSRYPVRTIELGVQSLCDSVLKMSRRGYCVGSVHDSAKRVRAGGWALGIQMMAGLPGDSRRLFVESISKAIALAPDFLRIYPTLVLEGTGLADSFKKGNYTPLSLDDAVEWLTPAYDAALRAGIAVIRMGLQPDSALEKPGVILGGPYHPALGYLVRCRWWRDRIDHEFASFSEFSGDVIVLRVSPNLVSDVIGDGKSNLRHWKARWNVTVKVAGGVGLVGIQMIVDR
jgi:histone acetyltransferase (RNA polymerase elongator complex component)